VATRTAGRSNRAVCEYLARFRRERLDDVRQAAENRLAALRRPRDAWRVLDVLKGGRGLMMDMAKALDALGPEYELAPTQTEAWMSDAWLAAGAAAFADCAMQAGTVDDMTRADESVMTYAKALGGDVAARRVLGARITNERKARRRPERAKQLRERFQVLVNAGLEQLQSEKTARADAVRTLAGEENVKPQRIRDILREK